MTSSAKRQFKRFEGFYRKGTLEDRFVKKLKEKFENGWTQETGVIQSWFDYCEEKHGKIEQVVGNTVDILDQTKEETKVDESSEQS